MKFVPAAFENEILTDTSEASDNARARQRMKKITMSADEQLQYKCAPNEARDNDNPGMPDVSGVY